MHCRYEEWRSNHFLGNKFFIGKACFESVGWFFEVFLLTTLNIQHYLEVGKHQMRKTPLVAFIFLVLLVSGCSLFKDKGNPYAEVGEINEKDPQTPAVILVGDPQVSSRESLINDRMREVDHLEEMIRDSKEVSFEPQLKRDLRVIRALASQLGISFNPASSVAFERQEDLAKLRTDVEIVKLRNELEKLKKLSQENPSDSALQPKTADQVGEKPGAKPGDPSVDEIKAHLNKAVMAADNLLKELQKKAADRAAETTIKASPEDVFEDLNAYRARLRQRQNEVRLDDVHDADGHALYRLQLTAAVLPGKYKNKFAVLDVDIAPVKIKTDATKPFTSSGWWNCPKVAFDLFCLQPVI